MENPEFVSVEQLENALDMNNVLMSKVVDLQGELNEEKRKHGETKKQLEKHRQLYYSAMRNK